MIHSIISLARSESLIVFKTSEDKFISGDGVFVKSKQVEKKQRFSRDKEVLVSLDHQQTLSDSEFTSSVAER